MASLTRENSTWSGSIEQTSQTKTYTFPVGSKYADKDISFTVNVNTIILANNSTFTLNDGINIWTWHKDENGNVTIT